MDLARFVVAQADTYPVALAELRRGRKVSHWMWFVFPQVRGLGTSPTACHYGIDGLVEARAYVQDPVLGPRLLEAAEAVAAAPGTATDVLGSIDALKLRSSMTLFLRAAPDEPVFQAVLDRFYEGTPDAATDRLLATGPRP